MRSVGRSLLVGLALAASQIVPVNAAIKVMPLGDSITEWGCWRAKLWSSLRTSGHADKIDFVGSVNTPASQCPGQTYDTQNEGHAGYLSINIANQNQLVNWLSSTRPEIVFFHLGTNDIFNSRSVNDIIASFGKLVDQMRASNPNMIILVAQIIPIGLNGFGNVTPLNNAIPAWAASKSTANSPITVVDQFTGFSGTADNGDGIHPNDSGDTKIARNWLEPLKKAIDLAESRAGGGGGTPTTSTSPSGPPTTSNPPVVVPTPTQPAGTVQKWGQCGGNGYNGPTGCVSGSRCVKLNDWYSQCQ